MKVACGLLAVWLAVCAAESGNVSTRVAVTKHCVGECQRPALYSRMSKVMEIKLKEHAECVAAHKCPEVAPAESSERCVSSYAGEYQCNRVDLEAFVPLEQLGTKGDSNDIWGWTDPETNREYAIICLVDGTAFVDVTVPTHPRVLGLVPTHTQSSLWRDAKVYRNYVFIVSEAYDHGMQVFDLTRLRHLPEVHGRVELPPDGHYNEFGSAHNLVLNEATGFAYAVGSKTCRGGLHMVDIRDPMAPKFAGCFSEDGYTHDAQCVVYSGPDKRFTGREICFSYNEDTLTIVDVTDKDAPAMIARKSYDNVFYTHQGWLLGNQAYLVLNDELDEQQGPNKHTRSLLWDVRTLDQPMLRSSFFSDKQAIDHNLYYHQGFVYESNYCAGLRILDARAIDAGDPEAELHEVAYFDVAPDCDSTKFAGTWSNYPYFKSGIVIVSSIERGLFVLRPHLQDV